MLSILSNLKNSIREVISKKRIQRRLKNYHVVVSDAVMNVNIDDTCEGNSINDQLSAPPPTPIITKRLFNTEIDETIIKNDYELQELLRMMELYNFDVTNVTLPSAHRVLV